MTIAKLIGYTTASEALAMGMTNHATYFGIPLWVAEDGGDDCLKVCAKWQPMEWVMEIGHYIEGLLDSIMFPDDEPVFRFVIGPEIEL